jgi:hypothetical protein
MSLVSKTTLALRISKDGMIKTMQVHGTPIAGHSCALM